MLFLGTYEYAMDERGRVPMPPRFRDAFTGGVILTQGAPDHCIRAYPTAGFEEQAALYMQDPVTTRPGRVMRREFFSRAYPAELDKQGRVLVPNQLRTFAGLDAQIVIVGIGDGVEIWNAPDWQDARDSEQDEFTRTLE